MPPQTVHLACLCAAWCRLCDDYRAVFERLAAELRASTPGVQVHWIDIEDEATLVGDLDIETFPTLVIAGPDAVRFAGALTPHEDTLRRLLAHAVVRAEVGTAWPPVSQDFTDFVARLRRDGRQLLVPGPTA